MAILGFFAREERAQRHAAQALYEALATLSRRPPFYGEGKVPDTLEGRLEVLTLHAALALFRLRAEPQANALMQSLTNILFRNLDAGLREAGVGDLTVPRKMRALAERFYGRLNAYGPALADGDAPALAQALGRIFWRDAAHPYAAPLAAFALATQARLAPLKAAELSQLSEWPAPPGAEA